MNQSKTKLKLIQKEKRRKSVKDVNIKKRQVYTLNKVLWLGKTYEKNKYYEPIRYDIRGGSKVELKVDGIQVIIPKGSKFKILDVVTNGKYQVVGMFYNFPEGIVDITGLCKGGKFHEEYFTYVTRKRS